MAFILPLFFAVTTQGAVVTNTNDSGAGSLRAAVTGYSTGDPNITFNIPSGSPGCTGTACTITAATTLSLTNFSGSPVTINGAGPNVITISGGNTVRVFDFNSGGVNFALNALTITNGSVAGNGAGISFTNGNSLSITNSTISNNAATGNTRQGGGLAIVSGGSTTNITNTTFSGNTTNGNNSVGGGIYAPNSGQTVNLNHATITLNTSTGNSNNLGGGIFIAGGTFSMNNSIVAQNTATGTSIDINGNPSAANNNVIGVNTGHNVVNGVNNNQVGTTGTPLNAMLSPLANNLGYTQTHALMSGSPAVDKASTGLTTDQRTLSRPYDNPGVANAPNGTGEDVGAFEGQGVTAAAVTVSGRINIRLSGRTSVTMTNTSSGVITRVGVSSFGYFSFTDVIAGETYIVQVESRQYQFDPQILTVVDDITDLNFSLNRKFR